jgi:hypothetical protein
LRECEECNQNSHIEGKINGYIKFKDSGDTMQGYGISAIYAMDIKWKNNLEPIYTWLKYLYLWNNILLSIVTSKAISSHNSPVW